MIIRLLSFIHFTLVVHHGMSQRRLYTFLDLTIPTVKEEVKNYIQAYKERITRHSNTLASYLMEAKGKSQDFVR